MNGKLHGFITFIDICMHACLLLRQLRADCGCKFAKLLLISISYTDAVYLLC